MSRKRWVSLIVPLLAGAFVVVFCSIYFSSIPWVSVAEFRSQVEREIPPGTPRPQVSAWLRAKGYSSDDLPPNCCEWHECGHSREFSNYRIKFGFPTVLRFRITFDDQDKRTTHLDVYEFTYAL